MTLLHDTAWLCCCHTFASKLPGDKPFLLTHEELLLGFSFSGFGFICNILEKLYSVEVVQFVRLKERESLLQGKAEGVGAVQPREERLRGDLIKVSKSLKGGDAEDGPGSAQW